MMGRSPGCWSFSKDDEQEGFNRGAWTAKEDMILTEYIKTNGVGRWRSLPRKAGLKRCGKSCRLRWLNYLRPDIKHGNISPEEEELLIRLHRLLGNRWSLIAGRLPGRTDNEIKNYWNSHLRKKVEISEFEPKIQKPFKNWDTPSYSDQKEEQVKDKDNCISQSTPLKTGAVRYCGKVTDNYVLKQDNHVAIIPEEEGLKAAADHVVKTDASKSWCQLLLEECIGDDKYDRLDVTDGLQANGIVGSHSFGIEHHLHAQFYYPTCNYETNSSYPSFFEDQEFRHSKHFHFPYFESFLDLSELPSFIP
jgi:hypothetical protein